MLFALICLDVYAFSKLIIFSFLQSKHRSKKRSPSNQRRESRKSALRMHRLHSQNAHSLTPSLGREAKPQLKKNCLKLRKLLFFAESTRLLSRPQQLESLRSKVLQQAIGQSQFFAIAANRPASLQLLVSEKLCAALRSDRFAPDRACGRRCLVLETDILTHLVR